MQIEFIKVVDVELKDVPPKQWGKLQKRAPVVKPKFEKTEDGVGKVSLIETTHGPLVHYFRVGVPVDLPDAQAQAYINAGAAKRIENPVAAQWAEVTVDKNGIADFGSVIP